MHLAQACVLLTSLLPIQILAAPAPAPAAIPATAIATAHEPTSAIAERALPAIAGAIVTDIVTSVVTEIGKGLIEILSGEAAAKQAAFTQNTVDRLRAQYPDYNVLVYHDEPGEPSSGNLQGAYHMREEIPWGVFDTTKGYDIWVFESGESILPPYPSAWRAGPLRALSFCFQFFPLLYQTQDDPFPR